MRNEKKMQYFFQLKLFPTCCLEIRYESIMSNKLYSIIKVSSNAATQKFNILNFCQPVKKKSSDHLKC